MCGAGAPARVFLAALVEKSDQANSEMGGPAMGRSGWCRPPVETGGPDTGGSGYAPRRIGGSGYGPPPIKIGGCGCGTLEVELVESPLPVLRRW